MNHNIRDTEVITMKKLSFPIILAVLSAPIVCRAQLISSFGVKGAFTSTSQIMAHPFASTGWWTSSSTSAEQGFDVAAFAEWPALPLLSIVTQVEYGRGGSKIEYTVDENSSVTGFASTIGHLDYISIPVMAKFSLLQGSVTPYVFGGPRVDFLVGYSGSQIQPTGVSIYSQFRKTMLGWSTGIGIETSTILPVDLLAELRYNIDLLDSFNNAGLTFRNQTVDLWFGVAV